MTYKDNINITVKTFFVMVGVIKLYFVDISSHQNKSRMYIYIKQLLQAARGSEQELLTRSHIYKECRNVKDVHTGKSNKPTHLKTLSEAGILAEKLNMSK